MENFTIKIDNGEIAVRDYGGKGKDMLLVHGTGHNLEVWKPLAELLNTEYRIWTFDTRGHGQTTLISENATAYWKDIEQIIRNLGINPILLVGHSTGGFAVSAYTAWKNSQIPIVILDGFVLDNYIAISEDHPSKIPTEMLWNLFRYGWETTEDEMNDYIKNQIEESNNDGNFNAGISKETVENFLRRSFAQKREKWLRKPTLNEIELVGNPNENEEILPDVNLYDKINAPIALVVATKGFYYHRKEEIKHLSSQKNNRYYFEVDTSHNLHMTKPCEVKEILSQFIKSAENQ